jgi:diguanylate cyclase (GGDEF)-like protein
MTIALAIATVVLAVLVAALIVMLVVRRKAAGSDDRVALAVADMNARMEAMARDLSLAVQRAEHETRRSRLLTDVIGSLDLDEVLARTLEAAQSLGAIDAALVSLPDGVNGKPLVATIGLSPEEAQREGIVAGPPDGRQARAVSVSFRYGDGGHGDSIQAGVGVPIPGEDGDQGFLAVFTRSADRTFGEADIAELEDLAHRAGPAIENARRFREARQQADLDPLTGLHNRRFFYDTLARETARAHRYERSVALIVFDLDDFKAINDRLGHLAGDGVLTEIAERLRTAIRTADVACRVGGDEFAIIMAESTLDDAEKLYARIQQEFAGRPIGSAGTLSLSAGAAALRPDDDAASFFERADAALYRAKSSGKGRLVTS